jgi:hypothetical protein
MKKIIFLLLLPFVFKAQEYKYCELVGYQKLFSSKLIVAVDSGGGLNWNTMLKDSADLVKPAEFKNEKFYVQTKEKVYEGKEVLSDTKGTFIWKRVEVNPQKTETIVKTKIFNSMIDGMNYMGEHGWEFVQAYAVTSGNQNVYRYVLKKKK